MWRDVIYEIEIPDYIVMKYVSMEMQRKGPRTPCSNLMMAARSGQGQWAVRALGVIGKCFDRKLPGAKQI